MGQRTVLLIFSLAFTGLTSGAGVLPDGPLNETVGETVMFTVSAVNGTIFTTDWQFEGERIFVSTPEGSTTSPGYVGRVSFFPSNGSLELRNVALSDSGEYSVSITAGTGAHDGTVTLNVFERISNIAVSVSGTDLSESDSVHFSCSVSAGTPPFNFLWSKGSSEVTASDRVQITATDEVSNLTITNVMRDDQETYKCNVSNPVSSGTSNGVYLTVNYGPESTTLNIAQYKEEYKEGEAITMSCSADSRPEAQFKWFVNDEELPNAESELRLTNLQIDDSGNYSCMASNSKTSKSERSVSVYVNVTESGKRKTDDDPCSTVCIALSVTGSLVVCGGAAAGGFFVYKKKSRKSSGRGGDEGRNNTTFSGDGEVNYADVAVFRKKDGGVVRLEPQNETAKTPPTYDAHMQRGTGPDSQPSENGSHYAQIQKK